MKKFLYNVSPEGIQVWQFKGKFLERCGYIEDFERSKSYVSIVYDWLVSKTLDTDLNGKHYESIQIQKMI